MEFPALREYQSRAIETINSLIVEHSEVSNAYDRSMVVVSPTGSGKTELAVYLILQALGQGYRSLFVVDDVSLVGQTRDRFGKYGHRPGMIAASIGRNPDPQHPIQVASIGTLSNRAVPRGVKLVIIDECHTCGYSATQRWWSETKPDGTWKHWDADAWVIGLTASPWRTKKAESLDDLYKHMVVVAQPSELIQVGEATEYQQGLVPPSYYGFRSVIDLSHVRTQMGDYRQSDLSVVVDNAAVLDGIVEQWRGLCLRGSLNQAMRTLFFGVSVDHAAKVSAKFNEVLESQAIAEGYFDGLAEFNAKWIDRRHLPGEDMVLWKKLDGGDSLQEREYWFDRMRQGYLVGLTCADVLTKGFDLPEIECVWPRPTKSLVVKVQQEGRAARPAPWINKRQFWIVDIGLNCLKPSMGRFDDIQPYSIAKRTNADKVGEAPMKECPECHKLNYAFHMVCDECGYEFPERDKKLLSGGLEKLLSKEERSFQLKYRRYLKTAYRNNYLPSWALIRVQEDMKQNVRVADIKPGVLVKVRSEWLVDARTKQTQTVTVRVETVAEVRGSGCALLGTAMGGCVIPSDIQYLNIVPAAIPEAMLNAAPWRTDSKDRASASATEQEMADYWLWLSGLAKAKKKDEAWCMKWYQAEFGADAPHPATLNFANKKRAS